MGNGKQTAQRTDQSNTVKNLSSNVNAINVVKNEPVLTIQRAIFGPELLSPGELPVLHQSVGNRVMQRMMVTNDVHDGGIAKPKENRTGMPDQLKAGLECLSGLDLANVRVNYNSDLPHQVGALAYTRGTDIYVAPGQEQHLPHEGWHVVQQMQGRVSPNFQLKGMGINDDAGLEQEAEEMGNLSAQTDETNLITNFKMTPRPPAKKTEIQSQLPLQCYWEETDYIIDYAASNDKNPIIFQSQGLRYGDGKYFRVDKTCKSTDKMIAITKEYDAATNQWIPMFGSILENPKLKVSCNYRFALEAVNQPRVFFIDDEMRDRCNSELKAKNCPYMIGKNEGVYLYLSNFNQVLYQASMIPNGTVTKNFQGLMTDALLIATECHEIAKIIGNLNQESFGEPKSGSGLDTVANPHVGEAFHFKHAEDYPDIPFERDWWKFGKKEQSFMDVVNEFKPVDEMLAGIGDKVDSLLKVMDNLNLSPGARGYLPGWGSHSEAVIAEDGPDRLTLAGYRRISEAYWICGMVLRRIYRIDKAFRQRLIQFIEREIESKRMSPLVFIQIFRKRGFYELLQELNYHIELANIQPLLNSVANNDFTKNLWYYEMYGPGEQSFHTQYQILGTRGLDEGQTIVLS